MDGFNKKTADRQILRSYQAARNERRWLSHLEPLVYTVSVVGMLLLLPVFFLPAGARLPYAAVWAACALIALITIYSLMVLWSRHGKRLQAFGIIVGFLGFAVLLLAAGFALLFWLV